MDDQIVSGVQGVKAKIDEALEKTDIDDKVMAGLSSLKNKITDAFKKDS